MIFFAKEGAGAALLTVLQPLQALPAAFDRLLCILKTKV